MRHSAVILLLLLLFVSCSRPTTTTADGGADAGSHSAAQRGWGSVMADVGRRFELAGRAATANRFELAAFEVDEMQELFEKDLPQAELPKEGPTTVLPGMADAFAKTHPPDLIKAANAKNARAFAEAFQRAAATCNGCHQASGHAFIQISPVPGKPVPDLDPVAAP